MDTGAGSMTPGGGATAERRVGQSMSMAELDEYFERCWKNAQRQKIYPSGSKRKTAEEVTFGRFIPYSETVANLERLKRETAQMRAELEAEMAACSISSPSSSPPPPPTPSSPPPPPPPPPPGRRRLIKKSRG